jgi:sarcosine/dimethylglycine N-methyltransferase
MTYTETDIIATIERLAGTGLSALSGSQLDGIDQYHAGGTAAIERLIPRLALTAGSTALDVGSGLGGPARQIARATGCEVVGVDITPAYVAAARALSEAAGLAERTRFFCDDIGAFDRTGFDAAYTVHVQMNIADKKAFYAEIARRLRPGARLAVFEVCRGDAGEPALPLPWSLDGTDSHLVTADELRETIRSSGFTPLDWSDESAWAGRWFDDLGRRRLAAEAAGAAAPATLPALLTDGPTRMLNFAIAVAEGAVTIHRGVFTVRSTGRGA